LNPDPIIYICLTKNMALEKETNLFKSAFQTKKKNIDIKSENSI